MVIACSVVMARGIARKIPVTKINASRLAKGGK